MGQAALLQEDSEGKRNIYHLVRVSHRPGKISATEKRSRGVLERHLQQLTVVLIVGAPGSAAGLRGFARSERR